MKVFLLLSVLSLSLLAVLGTLNVLMVADELLSGLNLNTAQIGFHILLAGLSLFCVYGAVVLIRLCLSKKDMPLPTD